MKYAKAIIIVVNANNDGQFDSLQNWLDYAKSNESTREEKLYIAATNCFSWWAIDPERIKQFADNNEIPFFPTNFETKQSGTDLFNRVASDLIKHW